MKRSRKLGLAIELHCSDPFLATPNNNCGEVQTCSPSRVMAKGCLTRCWKAWPPARCQSYPRTAEYRMSCRTKSTDYSCHLATLGRSRMHLSDCTATVRPCGAWRLPHASESWTNTPSVASLLNSRTYTIASCEGFSVNLKWQLNRLRAMSAAEIASRAAQMLRSR